MRYTTDGADLSGLKKALSQSRDTKEVILLDDCFGQAYFSMKETQENELMSLIRHVKMNPNRHMSLICHGYLMWKKPEFFVIISILEKYRRNIGQRFERISAICRL